MIFIKILISQIIVLIISALIYHEVNANLRKIWFGVFLHPAQCPVHLYFCPLGWSRKRLLSSRQNFNFKRPICLQSSYFGSYFFVHFIVCKHTNNGWFYFTNNQPGLLYQSNQNFPSKLTEIDEIQNLIPTFPFPWFYPNSPTAGSIQNYESQQSNPRWD